MYKPRALMNDSILSLKKKGLEMWLWYRFGLHFPMKKIMIKLYCSNTKSPRAPHRQQEITKVRENARKISYSRALRWSQFSSRAYNPWLMIFYV